MFFFKSDIQQNKKKAPGRDAGHRSPSWGCTKTQIFNENNQKSTKIRKSTQIPNWGRAGFIF